MVEVVGDIVSPRELIIPQNEGISGALTAVSGALLYISGQKLYFQTGGQTPKQITSA